MNLANDYFLLYHGSHVEKKDGFEIKEDVDFNSILDESALILSTNRNSCSKFLALESFEKVCLVLTNDKATNMEEIQQLQFSILERVRNEDFNSLHKSFTNLKESEVLSLQNYEKLISLFEIEEINNTFTEHEIEFKIDSLSEAKKELEHFGNELKLLIDEKEYLDEVSSYFEYIRAQKFSIGITGIMNAGKSTLLNALMGKEVLGTSTIPETANLTIISYDANPRAKVFYWNKKEWAKIEKSAEDEPLLKEFVQTTSKHFGNDLKNYITETSKVDEINVEDLSLYTSAAQSDKKCNLVKYVELGANLDFLSDGIEIVDTPGLDDLVVKREEITKEYLSNCDLMMHLMNVSQSATKKDIEFIIDALLYQNVSKLLVVLTRADSVDKKDLDEVIEYTKKSIKSKLSELNKSSQIENVLASLTFMSVSGKMALLHRTGKDDAAIEAGYKLEQTGILEIEEYLYKTLYGKNSEKNILFLNSAKYRIRKIIDSLSKTFNYQLILLGKSDDELEIELKNFKKQKEEKLNLFKMIEDDINSQKIVATKYLLSLQSFLDSEIIALQSIIKNRVVDDVKYTLEKNKKVPPKERIKVIVDTALKDGLIDIVRDYRYKFIKKTKSMADRFEQNYKEYELKLASKSDDFDVQKLFSEYFDKSFSTSNSDALILKIDYLTSKTKLPKIHEFDNNLQDILTIELQTMQEEIKQKASGVSKSLVESFFENISEPLNVMNKRVEHDEKVLKEQIERVDSDENEREKTKLIVHQKIKTLEKILKKIEV